MLFETVVEIPDKSYYADRLEKLTGKSRQYWSFFPSFKLQEFLKKELMKKAQSREVCRDHKN